MHEILIKIDVQNGYLIISFDKETNKTDLLITKNETTKLANKLRLIKKMVCRE